MTIFFNHIVYAQDSSFNNKTTKIINNDQNKIKSSDPNYNYDPSLLLNGTDFVDFSHNSTLSLENFTIAAWIKTADQSRNLAEEPSHLVNKGGFNTDKKGENMNYGIWFSNDGIIHGGFETESGQDFDVNSITRYDDGKWHYVLLSYDGSLLRLDIDGKKQISTTKNTNGAIPDTTGDQPLRIGANSLDESKFFTGNIDEVRVWNRGLTDKEISEIYANNAFDSKGQIIYLDFGGHGGHGTNANNYNSSSDIPSNAPTIAEEEEEKDNNLSSQSPPPPSQEITSTKQATKQATTTASSSTDIKNITSTDKINSPSLSSSSPSNNNTLNSLSSSSPLSSSNASTSPSTTTSGNGSKPFSNETTPNTTTIEKKQKEEEKEKNNTSNKAFNIAVAADWGCNDDAKKTSKNIQDKDPELVIAAGDLSYEGSAICWEDIISPFESKLRISMGDHEYHDTQGGAIGVLNDYLKPLNLANTYYSFDLNNVHFIFIDPYKDYRPGSAQYQFIDQDLKTASTNPKIDWTFVVEHIPMYTSPSKHPADYTIRDIYHPLFDKYGVDLVFGGDNHNYQRTFPIKYNNNNGYSSNNPIISNSDQNNYNVDSGVIYLITGTAGRSHYEIKQQAPFIAKQDDKHFGFLNIDINDKTLKATFYANENPQGFINVGFQNN
ncbi:MAG TPA: LamG-like jellyroll fold domain-containing protein, partial [Nitrososphaeraceae archaeon]|nr:LamG-like jellyroll fold domain-containing protein [Nitrososphaeraceae archaeon]